VGCRKLDRVAHLGKAGRIVKAQRGKTKKARAPKPKARRRPVPKPARGRRLPADPRPKALVRYGAVTGHVFHDASSGTVFLLTSDHRRKIADLMIVGRYTSPRHEPGTEMVMYRAFIDDVEFVGRASGLVLVLRPFTGGGFH
jgi:hypothetical protein